MANYAPTTWATGDTITATKLNNAENGLNNLTIAGTANQVLVNGATTAVNNAAITLTLPQSIAAASSPTFAGLTLTSSGSIGSINLGLGSAPKAHDSGFTAFHWGGLGALFAHTAATAGYTSQWLHNAYYASSTWKRMIADEAARIYTADGVWYFETAASGVADSAITWTTAMTIGATGGVQLGAPTGGDKGAGTLNTAADIYKNNSAYTNPDYVLEHWATGRVEKFADKEGAKDYGGLLPLSQVKQHVRDYWHLPRFGQQAGHGLFSGGDALLASLEEAYLYIFQLESRVSALEAA